jgi:hypothetical protein
LRASRAKSEGLLRKAHVEANHEANPAHGCRDRGYEIGPRLCGVGFSYLRAVFDGGGEEVQFGVLGLDFALLIDPEVEVSHSVV